MEIRFEKKFFKQLSKIKDRKTAIAVKEAIVNVEKATSVSDIKHLKKLVSYKNAFRIKVQDFRIGIIIENDTVDFVCLMDRKEVYKYFP